MLLVMSIETFIYLLVLPMVEMVDMKEFNEIRWSEQGSKHSEEYERVMKNRFLFLMESIEFYPWQTLRELELRFIKDYPMKDKLDDDGNIVAVGAINPEHYVIRQNVVKNTMGTVHQRNLHVPDTGPSKLSLRIYWKRVFEHFVLTGSWKPQNPSAAVRWTDPEHSEVYERKVAKKCKLLMQYSAISPYANFSEYAAWISDFTKQKITAQTIRSYWNLIEERFLYDGEFKSVDWEMRRMRAPNRNSREEMVAKRLDNAAKEREQEQLEARNRKDELERK